MNGLQPPLPVAALSEFDVWKSDDNRWTARPVVQQFVDDSDAPYSFSKHIQRVTAQTARLAVQGARSAFKASN